jgi:flagellar hook assembly protein FlgD
VPDTGAGAQAWDWNGQVGGSRVADGRYMLQLAGTAEGRAYHAPSARPVTAIQVAAYGVLVDTVAPVLTSTSASRSLISPNGDGVKDTVKLSLAASGSTRWTVRIADPGGTAARTVDGTGTSGAYTWNGTAGNGSRVADGAWQATLIAWDNAGNSARKTYRVTVDTTAPAVTPSGTPPRQPPDGDGTADDAPRLTSNERVSGTADLKARPRAVVDPGPRLVWAVSGMAATPRQRRRRNGVPREGPGGNRTVATTPVVVTDRGALRWSRDFPAGRGCASPGRRTWKLGLRRRRRCACTTRRARLRTVGWEGQPAGSRSWTWDGRLADGTFVPQGRYVAELTATSWLGTTVLRRTVWAAAFAATLSPSTVAPGQKLVIRFRTVEPLATRPVVRFTQPGRDTVKVTVTRLDDGSYRAVFTVQAGAAGAGSVRIDAKDTGGQVNTTTLAIRVSS